MWGIAFEVDVTACCTTLCTHSSVSLGGMQEISRANTFWFLLLQVDKIQLCHFWCYTDNQCFTPQQCGSGCSVCHTGWGVPKPKWVDSIQSQALPDAHPHCSINVRVSRDKSSSLQGLSFTFVNRIFWVIHVSFSVSWTFFAWTMLSQIPASPRSPASSSGHLNSEKAIGNLW